jgi:branched-subunit amino acid aminotransferase/4-amino-4-deoxychorismate lyase
LATTSLRLPPVNALSAIKTSNKLLHILAKAEAEAQGADEGLLLTASGELAQGTSSNLFWIEGQTVCTPPEAAGILPGVTRTAVLRACEYLKISVRQSTVQPEGLRLGVFMTLSTFGIVEAASLDDVALGPSPVAGQIRDFLSTKS